MEEKKTTVPTSEELKKQTPDTPESAGEHVLSETWAQDALQYLDDFIESQGIYILHLILAFSFKQSKSKLPISKQALNLIDMRSCFCN